MVSLLHPNAVLGRSVKARSILFIGTHSGRLRHLVNDANYFREIFAASI